MLPASELGHPHFDTIVTLPPSTGIFRIADECRAAALSFVNGACTWDKLDLALWLSGAYSRATSHIAHVPRLPADAEPTTVLDRPLEAEVVSRVLLHTHDMVMETLRAASNPEYAEAIAAMAMSNNLIAPCEDEQGRQGWAPVSRPRVVLADRVVSLVAADFLTRPHDYHGLMALCERCGSVVFDPIARAMGLCNTHRSGVVPRRTLTTMPAPPSEGA